MTIATRIKKNVYYAKQSAQGVIAAPGGTSQALRFLSFEQNLTKENYKSAEIRPDRQIRSVHLGPQECNGTLSAELSPATYKDFMTAILRKAWAAAVSTGAKTDIAAAATTGAGGTFTRGTGSYLTDGFKLGDVVTWTGWTETANNNHNFLITGLTALVMTVIGIDGNPPVAEAAGDSVTCTLAGKKTWAPASGHSEDWFTIEHNYSDIDFSEVFIDCKPSTLSIKSAASGIPTIDLNILGLDMKTYKDATAPYFTAPTEITTTEQTNAGNAVIVVAGTQQTLATSINIDINGNQAVLPAVIGSVAKPGISDGIIEVTGAFTLFFENGTYRDLFLAGTEVAIYAVFPESDAPNSNFVAISIPQAKLTSSDKSGDYGWGNTKEIIQTFNFQAEYNAAGGVGIATEQTTISIQDSEIS